MNVTILSMFRNSQHNIQRYMHNMDDLQALLCSKGHSLSLVLAYGDSTDCTGEQLQEECSFRAWCKPVEINHGGPVFGSVINRQRFEQLAIVANAMWQHIPDDADVVGMIESDLLWTPETLLALVEGLGEREILSPMIMHQDGRFYDTWAFRKDGLRFTNEPPYHKDVKLGQLLRMDSVGSCFFLHAEDACQLTFPKRNVVVGFCRQAREHGMTIHLDTTLEVFHP